MPSSWEGEKPFHKRNLNRDLKNKEEDRLHVAGKEGKNAIGILQGSPKSECAKIWIHEPDWQFLGLRSHIV